MAESKEGIPLDNFSIQHRQSQRSEPHPLLQAVEKPDALFANLGFARCFLAINVVLLALTAHVFQSIVFPESAVILFDDTPLACSSNCTKGDARCQEIDGTCLSNGVCFYASANDGATCAGTDFTCWNGKCLSSSDSCYGKLCRTPADDRCVASVPSGFEGTCVNGACHYPLLPDNTPCPAVRGDSEKVTALKGWTCQQGLCTSPTRHAVADFAYSASIQAGIIGSALALEIILTGDFTPDLAALAINSGLIIIGWNGFFVDTGLEADSGIGRTQVAFGFIAGGLAVLFGNWLISTKSKDASPKNGFVGIILVALWLVTFGLVSHILAQTFEHFDSGMLDDNVNITYFWAYQATIFAASVNIAFAHTLLRTNSYTSGFAAFAAITGVIALAWASQHQDKEGEERNQNDYTETALAWQSFAIISGAISIVFGFVFALFHKPPRSDDYDQQSKGIARIYSLVVTGTFLTIIGLVAALFTKHYFERSEDVYGFDPRVVGGENSRNAISNNYGNQISPFAWDFSIWASAVGASFGIELFIHGGGSGGITALAVTQAANLVGWAAKHTQVGSVRPDLDELHPRTEAWAGVSLAAGLVCVLLALFILRLLGQVKAASEAGVVVHPHADRPDGGRSSLAAEDRELFATDGAARQGHNEP